MYEYIQVQMTYTSTCSHTNIHTKRVYGES